MAGGPAGGCFGRGGVAGGGSEGCGGGGLAGKSGGAKGEGGGGNGGKNGGRGGLGHPNLSRVGLEPSQPRARTLECIGLGVGGWGATQVRTAVASRVRIPPVILDEIHILAADRSIVAKSTTDVAYGKNVGRRVDSKLECFLARCPQARPKLLYPLLGAGASVPVWRGSSLTRGGMRTAWGCLGWHGGGVGGGVASYLCGITAWEAGRRRMEAAGPHLPALAAQLRAWNHRMVPLKPTLCHRHTNSINWPHLLRKASYEGVTVVPSIEP